MGKGSKSRVKDKKKYDKNYDAIFRARKALELGYKIAPFNGKRNRANIIPPTPV